MQMYHCARHQATTARKAKVAGDRVVQNRALLPTDLHCGMDAHKKDTALWPPHVHSFDATTKSHKWHTLRGTRALRRHNGKCLPQRNEQRKKKLPHTKPAMQRVKHCFATEEMVRPEQHRHTHTHRVKKIVRQTKPQTTLRSIHQRGSFVTTIYTRMYIEIFQLLPHSMQHHSSCARVPAAFSG